MLRSRKRRLSSSTENNMQGGTIMQRTSKLMAVVAAIVIGVATYLIPSAAVAGEQMGKSSSSIDVASIVNFKEADVKSSVADQHDETIVNTGGNTGLIIMRRPQALSVWDRYSMDSSMQSQKGGILGSGIIAAFKIPIW